MRILAIPFERLLKRHALRRSLRGKRAPDALDDVDGRGLNASKQAKNPLREENRKVESAWHDLRHKRFVAADVRQENQDQQACGCRLRASLGYGTWRASAKQSSFPPPPRPHVPTLHVRPYFARSLTRLSSKARE